MRIRFLMYFGLFCLALTSLPWRGFLELGVSLLTGKGVPTQYRRHFRFGLPGLLLTVTLVGGAIAIVQGISPNETTLGTIYFFAIVFGTLFVVVFLFRYFVEEFQELPSRERPMNIRDDLNKLADEKAQRERD